MSPTPRKRFGQHFLSDQAIIARIVAALNPKPNEHLIEIGPGQGALTMPVLKQVHHLEVIELDRDLIPLLEERTSRLGKLIIHQADILDFDLKSLKTDDRLLRVFGNLPYNISTPLIFHLLQYADEIKDMLFMLQKEVAERLAAPVNSEHYGRLSVMVQYHCQVELLFPVPPQAFYPPPNVKSAMVKLLPYRQYPFQAKNYALFADMVRHAFGQRRKTLRNSLKDYIDDDVWIHTNLNSNLRPENLSVADFVTLSNIVSDKGISTCPPT